MTRRIVLGGAATLLVAIGLLPVLSMLLDSVIVDGAPSFGPWAALLSSPRPWWLLGRSLLLSGLVTSISVVAGVPLGLLFEKTDLPWRRGLAALFTVPLLIPPYIFAVAWADLLGSQGPVTRLAGVAAARGATELFFGLPGCVFVLALVFLPVPMLLTMVFLRTIDPRLEEAGRLVSGWPRVLAAVSLPLIAPGVTLSALLVFVLVLGEVGVPSYLRYVVFPVESFTQFAAFHDFRSATVSAVLLAAFALVLLVIESRCLRARTVHLVPAAPADRLPRIGLGRWRRGVSVLVTALGTGLVAAPFAALAMRSANAATWIEAFTRAGGSLSRSVLFAALGASLMTGLGFFIGYLVHTRAFRAWRLVDSLTLFLLALPGSVIGVGLISLWNRPWTRLVYATPAIIVLGYAARYTALASRIVATRLGQIPASMEEAARLAGAGWLRTMAVIVAPLAARGLLGGWLVGYVFSLRDVGITMMVYPPGQETLPVRILTLMANGRPELIAALCLMMAAATLLPIGLLWAVPAMRRAGVIR